MPFQRRSGQTFPLTSWPGMCRFRLAPTLVTQPAQGVLLIRNENPGPNAAFVLVNSAETTKPQDSAKLIFHRYGNRYFLNQVWTNGETSGYSVPKSQDEISVGKELMGANRPEAVSVVASLR